MPSPKNLQTPNIGSIPIRFNRRGDKNLTQVRYKSFSNAPEFFEIYRSATTTGNKDHVTCLALVFALLIARSTGTITKSRSERRLPPDDAGGAFAIKFEANCNDQVLLFLAA